MEKLRRVVEETDTAAGKIFDLFFQFLILFSIISFSLETLPELDEYYALFDFFELAIVALFTVEYCLRILVARKKLSFVFSFYGAIDFLAILPYYLSFGGLDLRSLRIFRLLRLLKFGRYIKALERLKNAFAGIKNELAVYFLITVFLLYLASVGIYYFEKDAQPEQFRSIFHSMWWALATLTTVGYGDIYPITTGGKIFTFFILLLGLGLVAVPSGLIASALTKKD